MKEEIKLEKSITDEILDEFLALLQEHTEFDAETIERVRQLALDGDLKKAARVTNIVKVSRENLR